MIAVFILDRNYKVDIPIIRIIGQVYVVISFAMVNIPWLHCTVIAIIISIVIAIIISAVDVMIRAYLHRRRTDQDSDDAGEEVPAY